MEGSVAPLVQPDRARARFVSTAAAVAALTLVGLAVRFVELDQGVFGDELFTFEVAGRAGLGDVVSGVSSDLEITPPLYFVLAWAAAKLGPLDVWMRVPSLVAGVLLVPATYVLGARTLGRAPALAGSALMAVAPFAVYFSTEARAYMLAALLVVLSTLALLRALERPALGRWALFAACVLAALYTHYTVVFALAGQAGWAVWAHRDRLRELALAHAAAGVAFLPWLPSFLDDRSAGFQTAIEQLQPLTFAFFWKGLVSTLAGHPLLGPRDLPGDAALLLIAAGVAAGALAGIHAARGALPAARARLRSPGVVLVGILAAATPVGAGVYSVFFSSVYLPRTLLASLPAICLVLGLVLTFGRTPFAVAATSLVLAGLVIGLARSLDDYGRPPFDEAGELVDRIREPGEPVFVSTFLLEAGSVEAHLEPPFRLWKTGCGEEITRPGQILTGGGECTGQPEPAARGIREALAAAHPRLVLMSIADAEPPPELAESFRPIGPVHRFEDAFIPIEVREYVRVQAER